MTFNGKPSKFEHGVTNQEQNRKTMYHSMQVAIFLIIKKEVTTCFYTSKKVPPL